MSIGIDDGHKFIKESFILIRKACLQKLHLLLLRHVRLQKLSFLYPSLASCGLRSFKLTTTLPSRFSSCVPRYVHLGAPQSSSCFFRFAELQTDCGFCGVGIEQVLWVLRFAKWHGNWSWWVGFVGFWRCGSCGGHRSFLGLILSCSLRVFLLATFSFELQILKHMGAFVSRFLSSCTVAC